MGQAQGQDGRSARCIALVGPYLSGKTTLLEAILARTGAISRQGSIADKNTVGDASQEAREHGMSVERSERLFRELAHQDPGNARQQAWRGTFDPMDLVYTPVKLAIYELREDVRAATEARGETFRLREFHDELLSYGAAPIPAIREAMLGPAAGPPLIR